MNNFLLYIIRVRILYIWVITDTMRELNNIDF
jgi:hypothetical protein